MYFAESLAYWTCTSSSDQMPFWSLWKILNFHSASKKKGTIKPRSAARRANYAFLFRITGLPTTVKASVRSVDRERRGTMMLSSLNWLTHFTRGRSNRLKKRTGLLLSNFIAYWEGELILWGCYGFCQQNGQAGSDNHCLSLGNFLQLESEKTAAKKWLFANNNKCALSFCNLKWLDG